MIENVETDPICNALDVVLRVLNQHPENTHTTFKISIYNMREMVVYLPPVVEDMRQALLDLDECTLRQAWNELLNPFVLPDMQNRQQDLIF